MKLGLSTYTYSWSIGVPGHLPEPPMTVLDLLDCAERLGVHVVQVADNLPLDQLAPAALDAFQDCAEKKGIQVEVGTRGIAPDHLRRYLSLARRFHSPILRVVVDTAGHHPSAEEVVEILAPFEREFEQTGICLAIENHDRFRTPLLAEIVRQLGVHWVGICLDTVNSFGALEGPQVVVDTLGPLTVNLHVKDFTIFRTSHMMGFTVEGRPAGQGKLDIPWLLGELKRHGRECSAILELWTPPESSLDETIWKERQWAEESVTYLRKLIED
jgi:3-oxoisoapionate decarboxylase